MAIALSETCFVTATKSFLHEDVRWNPELQEWFCAKCGRTSDRKAQADAVEELSVVECSLPGTRVKNLTNEQRRTRAKTLPPRH